jgi:pyruvate/2-oxoglutarate dehydrogenase complex dihydrolipoamide acyltransferase (E2) component
MRTVNAKGLATRLDTLERQALPPPMTAAEEAEIRVALRDPARQPSSEAQVLRRLLATNETARRLHAAALERQRVIAAQMGMEYETLDVDGTMQLLRRLDTDVRWMGLIDHLVTLAQAQQAQEGVPDV